MKTVFSHTDVACKHFYLDGSLILKYIDIKMCVHLASNLCAYELLGVVEAGLVGRRVSTSRVGHLDEVREVVVLGRADEPGDGDAGERAAARVEVVQQHLSGHLTHAHSNHLECFWVKLNNGELCLQQLGPVNLEKDFFLNESAG